MVKYIWPKAGQSFAEAIEAAKPKKRGRPLGSKNSPGHRAGRPRIYLIDQSSPLTDGYDHEDRAAS
jgi:hypothetical protein